MSESVKIASLDLENVKRVKAVKLEPTPEGLTVIGGRNGQGKTSVLDAIAWALGGDRLKPSQPHREGSATDPYLKVELSNGLIVERKGKNSSLKVMDPSGGKSGQMLLDKFIETLALDLPKFLTANNKDKAKTLLETIGVGEELFELDDKEEKLMNQRLAIGQVERQKRGAAEEMTFYPDAPEDVVSAYELIAKQQEILAKNGENQKIREQGEELLRKQKRNEEEMRELTERIADLTHQLDEKRKDATILAQNIQISKKTVAELKDESTEEIEKSISEIDEINTRVRSNEARAAAMKDADELKEQYEDLTHEIEMVRKAKTDLLNGAKLPLKGLSVEKGELLYNGAAWDCMSGSDQLKVATAIVRAIKPECGFVLIDKLEQFDSQTLEEFGQWAAGESLQIIGTRVSTGDECSIVIEDGYSSTPKEVQDKTPKSTPKEKEEENPWKL